MQGSGDTSINGIVWTYGSNMGCRNYFHRNCQCGRGKGYSNALLFCTSNDVIKCVMYVSVYVCIICYNGNTRMLLVGCGVWMVSVCR